MSMLVASDSTSLNLDGLYHPASDETIVDGQGLWYIHMKEFLQGWPINNLDANVAQCLINMKSLGIQRIYNNQTST